jgi:hypothetical protein
VDRFPAGAIIFYLSITSTPTLGPTQPPIQWVPGTISPGGKGVEYAEQDTSVKAGLHSACRLLSLRYLVRCILPLCKWKRYVVPKHRLTFGGLHGVMSQKMIPLITTGVRTSNPTKWCFNAKACGTQRILDD